MMGAKPAASHWWATDPARPARCAAPPQLILGDAVASMGLKYESAADAEAAVAFLEESKAAPAVIFLDEKCARGRLPPRIRRFHSLVIHSALS